MLTTHQIIHMLEFITIVISETGTTTVIVTAGIIIEAMLTTTITITITISIMMTLTT